MVDGVKAMAEEPKPDRPREDGLVNALERVKKYVELYPYPSLGAEILYDDAFRSKEWPRRAYALNRTDIQDLLNDLEIYEDKLSEANARAIQDAKAIDRLTKLVESMRINGARHWFAYGHQKCTNVPLGHWVDICKICDQERDHPAHFATDAKYLDSREVVEAAQAAQERLCNLLVDGMKLSHTTALNTARELLRGLPGIADFQPVPGRPEVQG